MSKSPIGNSFFGKKPNQTLVIALSFVLLVTVISFLVYEGTKNDVILTVNGKEQKISTHSKTVGELFEKENFELSQFDHVTPTLDSEIVDGMTIEWAKARKVTIFVDGEEKVLWTTANKVEDILKEGNINISEYDQASIGLNEDLGDRDQIEIARAFQLTLLDGTTEKKVWSTSTTVANFLKQQDIKLSELDRVENDLNAIVKPNDKITIVRVEKVTDVVEEEIGYPVETKSDSSLLKGEERVISRGQKGKVTRTYEITKENGKVVAKDIKEEKIIQNPQPKVVAVGTKVLTAQASRGSNATTTKQTTKSTASTKKTTSTSTSKSASTTSSKEFYVTATAYTPYCSGCSGVSASGIDLKSNPNLKLIAVDPNIIPLGSKVWVEGYGYAVAGDTGGSIKGNKIDVLFQSKEEAYNWGRKKVLIKVLN